MARRPSLVLSALATGAVLLVAVGTAAEAPKGGTLRLAQAGDVTSLDPALVFGEHSYEIVFATCANLFNYPDKSGAAGTRVIQEVVRHARVSRDRRVYTFDLKRTFHFNTGAPVTAHSFAAAFDRVAIPRMKSFGATYMREIVGAVAVMEGKAQTISGVRVLDTYRLQFRLTRPAADFTARLTMPYFCPIPPNTPVDPAGMNEPPGSGPYYVDERVVNRRIVLKRNPYYRGPRPANVDRVVVTIGGSGDACLLAAEHDRIDHCSWWSVPPAAYRRLATQYGINRPGGQFFVEPTLSTGYLAFNHDRPAFKGPGQIALKKAINYAIDRAEISARALGYLGGEPTDQMLPPALGRRDERIYPLKGADPATARTWLAKAKIQPSTLVFYASNSRAGALNAQLLTSYLKRIGIDLEVKTYDFKVLLEKVGTQGEPFDLYITGLLVDYADPAASLGPLLNPDLRATGNTNFAYYSKPWVTARMDAANRLSGAARRNAWADLEVDLMRTDPPWAPLTNHTTREFISPSYGCFVNHLLSGPDLAAACKKK